MEHVIKFKQLSPFITQLPPPKSQRVATTTSEGEINNCNVVTLATLRYCLSLLVSCCTRVVVQLVI